MKPLARFAGGVTALLLAFGLVLGMGIAAPAAYAVEQNESGG